MNNNTDIARALYAAFARADVAAVLATLAPGISDRCKADNPPPSARRFGPDGTAEIGDMKTNDPGKLDRVIAEARRLQDERAQGYRERALKIYPWICGRCAREFTHRNLRELTVHHRDHNHDNNPPDGSNWELLCLYCHDNEHQRQLEAAGPVGAGPDAGPLATHAPFAVLKDLLGKKPAAK